MTNDFRAPIFDNSLIFMNLRSGTRLRHDFVTMNSNFASGEGPNVTDVAVVQIIKNEISIVKRQVRERGYSEDESDCIALTEYIYKQAGDANLSKQK